MSYCRDPVYIYSDGAYICCHSKAHLEGGYYTNSWIEMIAHVMEHMASGMEFPAYTIDRLWQQLLASETGVSCYGLEFESTELP